MEICKGNIEHKKSVQLPESQKKGKMGEEKRGSLKKRNPSFHSSSLGSCLDVAAALSLGRETPLTTRTWQVYAHPCKGQLGELTVSEVLLRPSLPWTAVRMDAAHRCLNWL